MLNNPTLNKVAAYPRQSEEAASYKGIALKTLYFVGLTILAAIASFAGVNLAMQDPAGAGFDVLLIVMIVSTVGALVCGLIASFAPRTVPVTGSLYAVFEGLAVGFLCCLFEAAYSGIIFAALLSTVGVFAVMSVLYWTGVIRVGSFFRKFMISAMIGIVVVNLIILIVSLFSPVLWNLFYGNSVFGLVISAVMVVFAALMLLMDFDQMTRIVENGLDKQYEWTAAYGLTLTLIYLFLRILQLLARIFARSRN